MPKIQIIFRTANSSPVAKNYIQKHFDKICQTYNNIKFCRVVIDVTQNRNHLSKLFNVSITIVTPGKQLIVNKNPNENLYIAISNAFSKMDKILNKTVKNHHPHINKLSIYKMIDNTVNNSKVL